MNRESNEGKPSKLHIPTAKMAMNGNLFLKMKRENSLSTISRVVEER